MNSAQISGIVFSAPKIQDMPAYVDRFEGFSIAAKMAHFAAMVFVSVLSVLASGEAHRYKRKAINVDCLNNGKFYRNPDPAKNNCYTYYLCVDETVYEYGCAGGLMFDIKQQICNFQDQVTNCGLDIGEILIKILAILYCPAVFGHPEIIPVGQFFRRWIKSINQSINQERRRIATTMVEALRSRSSRLID